VKHSHIAYFLTAALLVYAALNYYLLKRTSQALDGTGIVRSIVLWVLVAFVLAFPAGRIAERFFHAGITDVLVKAGSLYLGIMFYGLLITLLIDLMRLANRFLPFFPVGNSAGRVVWLLAAGIILSIIFIGHIVAVHPRLRTMDLNIAKKVPGFSTLSIVAVSDMHLGTVVGIAQLQRIITLIKTADPDIVLFAGDVFDMDVSDEMEREIAQTLGGLSAKFGVFAVTGNHEYYGGLEKAVSNLVRGRVTVLQDTAVKIADAFYLIGRKDLTAVRAGSGRKTLEEICSGVDRALPLILMDHQPFHLEEAKMCGIDLQVSGHTHNAQLFPLNLFYGLIYEKSSGWLKKGNTNIVVSCGAGTRGPPVRTSSISEVLHIRLHFAK
jgi:predicted MPP superfamily phosphohydrolase